jgi:hypothetical protein
VGSKLQFSAYGLGWALSDYHGRLVIAHSGGLDGMFSLSVIVPQEKLGVVVLTNYDEQEFYEALPYHVVDAYLNLPPDDRNGRSLKARRERDRRARDDEEKEKPRGGTQPSLQPSGYAGVYRHPALGRATVTNKDGKLFIQVERYPGLGGEMKHWQFDTFRVEWADPYFRTSLVPFRLDENGRAEELRFKVRPDFVDPMEYRLTREP